LKTGLIDQGRPEVSNPLLPSTIFRKTPALLVLR
jgi:hypothetical protein